MGVKTEKGSKAGQCLVCQRDVGFFRKLANNRFCSAEHEEKYMAELKDLALGRLETARTRINATRSDSVPV
jgi:hypothetical protein